MFSPDVLRYMRKALDKEEERERHETTPTAPEEIRLPKIFGGDPTEAEQFIYQFAAYFMAHDNEPRLASPAARAALTLTCIRGEEVDQWVNRQLDWLELQDCNDLQVGEAFVQAFFEEFVPKNKWQSNVQVQMKWPFIDEYIFDFEKAYVHKKMPLKGVERVQRFIEGLAGSVKRALPDKFRTYEQVRTQASHIVNMQKVLHRLHKSRSAEWTDAQGRHAEILKPQHGNRRINAIITKEEWKRQKRVRQENLKAARKARDAECYLHAQSLGELSPVSTDTDASETTQENDNEPTTTNEAFLDDLCIQLDKLSIEDHEEAINRLRAVRGESYGGLIRSAWRKKSDTEGIYLSIQKSMQLRTFIHLAHRRDEATALLDSGATENFINEAYAQQLKLPVKRLLHP